MRCAAVNESVSLLKNVACAIVEYLQELASYLLWFERKHRPLSNYIHDVFYNIAVVSHESIRVNTPHKHLDHLSLL